MPEELKSGEMPEQEPQKETPKEKPAEIASQSKDASELEAELEKTRKALKDANKEAAERRKRLEELEKAEQERQQAQMSEQEKLQLRLKELEQANAEKERLLAEKQQQELQTRVAKAVAKELGLSFDAVEGLADRLRGSTEEELTADAQKVFALLPKQEAEKKKPPVLDATNPGDAKKGETRAQMKLRTGLQKVNIFDPDYAKTHGGGVEYTGDKE
jgi:hypothetical protein